jgi:ferredoxin
MSQETTRQEQGTRDTAVSPPAEAAGGICAWEREQKPWANFLERIALTLERPVNRFIGNRQLNPFYHTGTIAALLTLIVGLTGFYVFLFYKYGFAASYLSTTSMNEQFIARIMRAVHRYASGALVVTVLLHGYRMLFMERFRGQRWLAWVSGIFMTFVVWLAGVTGYWLIGDQRAQLINDGFVTFLSRFTPWGDSYVLALTRAQLSGESWPIFLIMVGVHVLLFLIVAGFFFIHIKRLSRAKLLPEIHWVLGVFGILLLVSAFFPVRDLPPAAFDFLPQSLRIDPIFLFYVPTISSQWAMGIWIGLGLITLFFYALPWTSRERVVLKPQGLAAESAPVAITNGLPKVQIIDEMCIGCTECARDCPYDAIEMVERNDESQHKYLAVLNPAMCVSCGICIGACDTHRAIVMGEMQPEMMWQNIQLRLSMARAKVGDEAQLNLIFACERHAHHAARPFLATPNPMLNEKHLEIVTVPCVGALPPDLLTKALDAGANEVRVVGCPPEDCRNREGNLWGMQRILRKRVPRLKRVYENAAITAAWVAPDEFVDALLLEPKMKVKEEENVEEPGSAAALENGELQAATALSPGPEAAATATAVESADAPFVETEDKTAENSPDEENEPEWDYYSSRRMYWPLNIRNVTVAFGVWALIFIVQILLTDIPVQPVLAQTSLLHVVVEDADDLINRTGAYALPDQPLAFAIIIDGEEQFRTEYTPEQFYRSHFAPVVRSFQIPPGVHDIEVGLYQPDGTRILILDRTIELAPGEIMRIRNQFVDDMVARGPGNNILR